MNILVPYYILFLNHLEFLQLSNILAHQATILFINLSKSYQISRSLFRQPLLMFQKITSGGEQSCRSKDPLEGIQQERRRRKIEHVCTCVEDSERLPHRNDYVIAVYPDYGVYGASKTFTHDSVARRESAWAFYDMPPAPIQLQPVHSVSCN